MSAGGEQGSPRLPPHEVLFAEVWGQHIKELHIRRWLSQRPASDLIQQGMIRQHARTSVRRLRSTQPLVVSKC